MLTSVRPDVHEGVVTVTMNVIGRRSEDIDAFMAALEKTGAFADLVPRQEDLADDGMRHAVLIGRYVGPAAPPAGPATPAAPKEGRAGL
jgi:hypothetical protein